MANLRFDYGAARGIFALMPTPGTESAHKSTTSFGVDLEESRRAANELVSDDVDALLLNGTLGEAATLTEDEWKAFNRTVVEAVDDRIPVISGPTALNTRSTIDRAIFLRDIGAHGLFLGRPMWNDLPPESIVDYYEDVATAVPEMGIVVYDNPVAFKSRISHDVWDRLAAIPQIVAAKYAGGIDLDPTDLIREIGDRVRVMPNERNWYKTYSATEKAAACWAPSAALDPLPLVRYRDAIFRGDEETARHLTSRMRHSYETWIPNRDVFSKYNIPLEKIRMNAAGYMDAGPCRPPYNSIPQEYENGAIESGRRWKELVEELRDENRDLP